MLSKDKRTAESVGEAMKDIFTSAGIDHSVYVTTINHHGVKMIPS
jgi:hypothetical protein